jgi:hypothetical protein
MEEKKLPEYEAPKMLTYTEEEVFEMLGPAHTGSTAGGNSVFQ